MTTADKLGFTLIELLVVVVIIGLLAAIAIPKFTSTKQRAYVAAMKSDLRNLLVAEEAFFADSAKYATYDTSRIRYRPLTGITPPIIVIGAGYWSATITHTMITAFSCAISVNTANPIVPSAGDGEPVCK